MVEPNTPDNLGTQSQVSFLDLVSEIPNVVAYSTKTDLESIPRNKFVRGGCELLGRALYSATELPPPAGKPVHYFHDPRLAPFTPAEAHEFSTRRKRGQFRLSLNFKFISLFTVYYILGLAAHMTKRRNGYFFLEALCLLDCVNIWILLRHYGVTHFYTSAHFQAYVFLMSEFRKKGAIVRLSGVQHGAWSSRSLANVTQDCAYDDYTLLSPRFAKVFRTFFDRRNSTTLFSKESYSNIQWKHYPKSHIAIALQNDNYSADLEIAEICNSVAVPAGIEVIIYPHPNPRVGAEMLERFNRFGRIEAKGGRFNNSLCLVARYSTLAMEFAISGGESIFVDLGETIPFDTEGLRVRYVSLAQLKTALEESINNNSQQVLADPGSG